MARTQNGGRHVQLVKPLARAYLLGYLSSTSPRIVSVLAALARQKISLAAALHRIFQVLRQAAAFNRFPAFCGILIGGSTLLQLPLKHIFIALNQFLGRKKWSIDGTSIERLAKALAALISASISFTLLNSRPVSRIELQGATSTQGIPISDSNNDPSSFEEPPETTARSDAPKPAMLPASALAGRTMDLTLFAVIRALDVLISGMWARTTSRKTRSTATISRSTPPILFCLSAATIMHAWFYTPSRLPSTYNHWISTAAELDNRLLLVLRHARDGTFIYGKDTGMAPLLASMCKDYGLPEQWGDPAQTIPVPCELVHMGCGKNCEKHALTRFWRGWAFAARMYAPLQLLMLLRGARTKARGRSSPSKLAITSNALMKATLNMARSSAFLGAFIALFYYGVCLARTRLGPKLFSPTTISPQVWDSGLCVLAGCVLCGSSILFEQERKRLEILFFVLPRAAAVWFPRRYLKEYRWREHAAFALSTAVVFTVVQERPERVRGMLGSVLHGVLSQG